MKHSATSEKRGTLNSLYAYDYETFVYVHVSFMYVRYTYVKEMRAAISVYLSCAYVFP